MKREARIRRVADALAAAGLDASVRRFTTDTSTARAAAAALGCDAARIVKSLVFVGVDSGRAVVVLLSGAARADEAKIAAVVGETIRKADAATVKAKTGFEIGGVPPLGHLAAADGLRVIMDSGLLAFDRAWSAAGSTRAVFAADPRALAAAADAQIAAIAADAE